jgi:hypothetical protein
LIAPNPFMPATVIRVSEAAPEHWITDTKQRR